MAKKKAKATPDHGVEPRDGSSGEAAGATGEAAAAPGSPPEAVDVDVALALAQEAVQAAPVPEVGNPMSDSEAPQAAAAAVPARVGRPSIYTDELAATICQRLSSGESLRSICRDDGMPDISTIMGWVFRRPEFFTQYRAAREMQAEVLADEMMEIADDANNDWMERHGTSAGYRINGEAIQRSSLRINTRQWIASRLLPKRWGDQKQVTVQNPDGSAVGQPIDPRTLSPEAREALADALRAALRQDAVDAEYEEQG